MLGAIPLHSAVSEEFLEAAGAGNTQSPASQTVVSVVLHRFG